MNLQTFRTTTLVVIIASALALSLHSVAHSSELIRLSDSQLDKVSAGYLAINVAADAHAVSSAADTFTNTITETHVNVGQPQDDGYVYTTGNGRAFATAIGQTVQTAVGGGFETNQDVVSVDVNHASVTLAVNPRAAERAAQRTQTTQLRQQRINERRAVQDQRRQELRDTRAERPRSERQLERVADRHAAQDQRIAERRERRDNRLASRLSLRDQQILQRQIRNDQRHRTVAANRGVQPTLVQHQVLEITVVTRTTVPGIQQ